MQIAAVDHAIGVAVTFLERVAQFDAGQFLPKLQAKGEKPQVIPVAKLNLDKVGLQ